MAFIRSAGGKAMERRLRTRVLLQTVLAAAGLVLSLLTMVWPEWIEELFGVEPDGGSGALEWLIALGLLAAAATLALLAHRGRRRLRDLAPATT
jgi:hypothetical protein